MGKSANLTVQQWGNSLAVRIPAAVARSARLVLGQPVEMVVSEEGIQVRAVGRVRLSLTQRLALYDPTTHGGEAMAAVPVGRELP
jgi:antitoxin MazE